MKIQKSYKTHTLSFILSFFICIRSRNNYIIYCIFENIQKVYYKSYKINIKYISALMGKQIKKEKKETKNKFRGLY